MPDTLAKLHRICEGLNKRFPGNDNAFHLVCAEESFRFPGELQDRIPALWTVGNTGGITKVNYRFTVHPLTDRPNHGQAAKARIKYPDRVC